MTTEQQIKKAIEARVWNAYNAARVSRGKNKGKLKAKCPPMGTDAAICWQAFQMVMNPYRVSIAQLMFLTPEQQAFFNLCEFVADQIVKDAMA